MVDDFYYNEGDKRKDEEEIGVRFQRGIKRFLKDDNAVDSLFESMVEKGEFSKIVQILDKYSPKDTGVGIDTKNSILLLRRMFDDMAVPGESDIFLENVRLARDNARLRIEVSKLLGQVEAKFEFRSTKLKKNSEELVKLRQKRKDKREFKAAVANVLGADEVDSTEGVVETESQLEVLAGADDFTAEINPDEVLDKVVIENESVASFFESSSNPVSGVVEIESQLEVSGELKSAKEVIDDSMPKPDFSFDMDSE